MAVATPKPSDAPKPSRPSIVPGSNPNPTPAPKPSKPS